MPTGDNPMAQFMRDYNQKYKTLLPIATIAAKMNTTPRTVMRWRDGERSMMGIALGSLAKLRKEYGME